MDAFINKLIFFYIYVLIDKYICKLEPEHLYSINTINQSSVLGIQKQGRGSK